MFTTTSVKREHRKSDGDGRNFALRPAVICRAAKRSIPMTGESSSSSMKHRKDKKERLPPPPEPSSRTCALRPERGEAGLLGVRRAGYGGIRRDTAGYGGIWRDMAGYGQIWRDTSRYRKKIVRTWASLVRRVDPPAAGKPR